MSDSPGHWRCNGCERTYEVDRQRTYSTNIGIDAIMYLDRYHLGNMVGVTGQIAGYVDICSAGCLSSFLARLRVTDQVCQVFVELQGIYDHWLKQVSSAPTPEEMNRLLTARGYTAETFKEVFDANNN